MKASNVGNKVVKAVLAAMICMVFTFGTWAQTMAPLSSFFSGSMSPAFVTGNDSQSVELGMRFSSKVNSSITAIHFFKANNSRGTHTGTIWSSNGTKLASVTFTNETSSGWQTQQLTAPVAIAAGTTYVVSYHTVQYAWSLSYFSRSVVAGQLTAPANAGVYAYGKSTTFPSSSWNAANYWVDVLLQSSTTTPVPAPTPAPTVTMPLISSQPANRTVTMGQAASFSVSASGSGSLNYQWMKNGAAISGANASNYTTPAASMSDNGEKFTCAVSNSAGSVTSNAAMLTVNNAAVAPSISSQPAGRSVTAGQTAMFSVSVSGTAPFTYQWMKNGVAISGAASSSFTTSAATVADNGSQFSVLVSNAAGNVTSSAATLTVNAGTLLLSVNPGSLNFGDVNLGSNAVQSVKVSNAGTANVTLSGLSYSGAGFTASGLSSGQILTPGQSATFNVTFKPAAAGAANGSVTVSSNSATPAMVSLSGAGIQAVAHTVSLSWTRSTSTVAGYQVYSATVSGGPYNRVTNAAVSVPSFTDSTVQNGKTYYYVVTSVDGSGMESAYSNQASAIVQ